jgi:hypothetical protein
MTPSI